MIRNRLWTLALLFSGFYLSAHYHAHDAIIIDHQLIKVVDAGQIDLIKLIRLQRDIKALLEGDKGVGLIPLGGKHYTTRRLAQLEETYRGNKKDKELQDALYYSFSLLQKATADYMNEARGYKQHMKRIIKRWSEQRERPNSTLLEWEHQADGKEHEQLKRLIHNFVEFEQFLVDLSRFLDDLSYSCKRTWKRFEKQIKDREL